MLERLKLPNTGPAPEMQLEYRRRVNLLTGTVWARPSSWTPLGGP